MRDIIQRLPENIANQIAAGEVIQRPASAVKELLENAVDAGADQISLIIEDAGKSLIQVTDNGKGMSPADARLAFERHATSKIRHVDDLFRIRTMGFRGEALASIAAVARVELNTRRPEDEHGIHLELENSAIIREEPVAANPGTTIRMKQLFFNVPARRNFLKSNTSELKHIIDEFVRVAMAYPDIFFALTSNGQEVFHLEKGSLKQRLVQLLGHSFQSKLVPIQEQTDYLNISGFVGKPETAKKTRGDQYIFVNQRFIRSAYLHHAIVQAYDALLPKDTVPMYALFIDLDPARLDINVHPTKQEIKFEDDKIVYAFVQSAIKHALAQFSISPTLDFELDPSIQQLDAVQRPASAEQQDMAAHSRLYQTFRQKNQAHMIERNADLKHWKSLYEQAGEVPDEKDTTSIPLFVEQPAKPTPLVQLHQTYILVETADGFRLIHQQRAHERILYEQYLLAMEGRPVATQQSLFPATVELSASDAVLMHSLLDDLRELGYQLEPFGNTTFIVQGTPADVDMGSEKEAIESILEQYKNVSPAFKLESREKLVRVLSAQHALKTGITLTINEMESLVNALFACSQPALNPSGKPIFTEYDLPSLGQ